MPPRVQRGALKAPRTPEIRRLVTLVGRMKAIVEHNASEIEKLRDEQRVQFKRLAQVQAELDAVKKAWERMRTVG